jgi:hypothetical protein
MSLLRICFTRAARSCGMCIVLAVMAGAALAQSISTTTVQGTVYLANGSPGSGTLQVIWPAFTTASNQVVTAGKLTVNIGADGFVSVNLAPNLGSSPAGLYYTAIYHMNEGTTNTEYWLGDPAPRIFQLGMPGSLTQQYVAVKFGGLVVKGASYAHYQVLVDR